MSVTKEPDKSRPDPRLVLNTGDSEALKGAELSVTDSQMEQEVREEDHRKLEVVNNTPAFDIPDHFESKDQMFGSPKDIKDHAVERSTEKHPPKSQHPLCSNENSELLSNGLDLNNHSPFTTTHDASESSSQSSMESSSSPNHTLNGVCSPSQHPIHPLSANQDGLSLHSDAVQVRLREMEAGHQLQVETLKKQVQELWSRLHVNGKLVRNTLSLLCALPVLY